MVAIGKGKKKVNKLTSKQKRFCHEYVIDHNGQKAATRAGYSEKSARVQASTLLTKPNIKEYLAKCEEKAFKNADISAEYVLKRLKKIVDDDISNYIEWGFNDEFGNYAKLIDSDTIDTWNVQEVKIGKDGQVTLKLYDKKQMLVKLGEHFGLWSKVDSSEDQETALDKLISSINKAVK